MNPFSIIFLIIGLIWIGSMLSIETVQTSQANKRMQERETRKDDLKAVLLNEAWEFSIEKKIEEDLDYRTKIENELNKKIKAIIGEEYKLSNLDNYQHKRVLLGYVMAKRGKVPHWDLELGMQNGDIEKTIWPRPGRSGMIKLLSWYESELRQNGGYTATIMNADSPNGLGCWYFKDITNCPWASNTENDRMW